MALYLKIVWMKYMSNKKKNLKKRNWQKSILLLTEKQTTYNPTLKNPKK